MEYKSANGKIELDLRRKEDVIRDMWRPKKTSERIFNVKSYGAKGNGEADDRKALQKAVDAVYGSEEGGNLFFPPGLYRISGPLEVPELKNETAVNWIGHSPGSTTIAPSKPMDYLVRMRGRGGSVKGIEFRGSDPLNGSVQNAKVCMLATDILDKIFSNTSFVWGEVHGLQITREGNNNLCVFDRLCQFSQNGKVLKGKDAAGNGAKITFAKLNPKKNDVHAGAYLKVGSGEGSVYHIDSVSGNSITVSPDLKSRLRPGTNYAIHVGSGLQTDRGSDNNVYGVYDCHFVGNAGAGLMVRGLYGHHIQGGNFDSNGITGIHIGSGMINTTPAYSGTVTHSYFENNGYSNIILDYPSGLSIIDPLLAKPADGTDSGVASITSLRQEFFDYDSTSVLYNGRLYQYAAEGERVSLEMEEAADLVINSSSAEIKLPPPPTHKFGEEMHFYIEDSGGNLVRVLCEYTGVNDKPVGVAVEVPAGTGYKITAFYSRKKGAWMVSYTTPV